MKNIINKDTTIEEETKHIELLNELIKEDMKNNNIKGLKYHTIALKNHKHKLNSLRHKNTYDMEL